MKDEYKKILLEKGFNKWVRQDKTMKCINEYIDSHYEPTPCKMSKRKVFYHYTEWSGWRFYLKALRHGDWRSIIGHIKE